MPGRAVAGVALQSVARMALRQATQEGIPLLLGQHAGAGDGGAAAVTPDHGALPSRPFPQGQDAVHQQQQGRAGQPLQGAQHRPFRGATDAPAIDLRGAGLTQGPGQGMLAQQGFEQPAALGREFLAVVEPCPSQGSRAVEGSTTAAANTGPYRLPRPTSSTPAQSAGSSPPQTEASGRQRASASAGSARGGGAATPTARLPGGVGVVFGSPSRRGQPQPAQPQGPPPPVDASAPGVDRRRRVTPPLTTAAAGEISDSNGAGVISRMGAMSCWSGG